MSLRCSELPGPHVIPLNATQMPRNLAIIILMIVIMTSCTKSQQKQSACGTQVCTDIFAEITISFFDNTSQQIVVNNYTAVNLRTNEVLHDNKVLVTGTFPPTYDVADDGDLKKIAADGDNILVSGTDPATGQVKTAVIRVEGG